MSLNAPKLYLDEHLSPRLSIQLRNHGFDVLSCRDAAMLGKSDDEQLEFAVHEQRALVTVNFRDFMVLYNNYLSDKKEHFGIIFST